MSGRRHRRHRRGRSGRRQFTSSPSTPQRNTCAAQPVTVIGGANSAGQAALSLAAQGRLVTLAIRGPDIAAQMSAYLADRVDANPQVTVRVSTEITKLVGAGRLEAIAIAITTSDTSTELPCRGPFCFIGAEPATTWRLHDVALDRNGFIRTDVQLDPQHLGPAYAALGRAPLPFETSVTAVFAAGDVRRGSMKRVASAVGEGASAIRSIHTAIGLRLLRAPECRHRGLRSPLSCRRWADNS